MTNDNNDSSSSPDIELIQPLMQQNQKVAQNALSAIDHSLVARLFPDKSQRMAKNQILHEMESGFDYRKRALDLAVETKLQAIEEMCNQTLMTGKSKIRRERQEFFAQQRMLLEEKLDTIIDKFNIDIDSRFSNLEKILYKPLRTREEQRLLNKIDNFHDMMGTLMDEFTAIVQEGVKR